MGIVISTNRYGANKIVVFNFLENYKNQHVFISKTKPTNKNFSYGRSSRDSRYSSEYGLVLVGE